VNGGEDEKTLFPQRRLTWSGLSLKLINIQIGKNVIVFKLYRRVKHNGYHSKR